MKHLVVIFIIAFVTLSGCEYKAGLRTVSVKDQYSIDVPYFLSKTRRLVPRSSFQYENKFRTFYVVCIDDHKDSTGLALNAYTDKVIASFGEKIVEMDINKLDRDTLGNFNARFAELSGNVTGKEIFYLLATIEGKNHFYQICAWTPSEKKEQHLPDFYKIVNSFKEIN